MNQEYIRSIGAGTIALALTANLHAQQKPATASPASPGVLNEWLRADSADFKSWDLGGQFRARYEVKENGGSDGAFANQDFMAKVPAGKFNDNNFLYLREKIHLGYNSSWFGAYVEARDSSSTGDKRDPNPGADEFDLHQAYVNLGNAKEFPLTLKIGRQELVYGDERLVGAGDWGNLMRSFDTAKVRFENKDIWVDAFTGRLVLPDNHQFNTPNDYDWFSGVYSSSKSLIPKQETQVYFLSRNAGADAATAQPGSLTSLPTPRDIYTMGARVKSLPGKLNGWDYAGEIAKQYGSINVGGKRLEHDALMGSIGGGFTWEKAWAAPRVGIQYDYASGDSNATDNKNETFENLFPTNHKFYGTMDDLGGRNLHDPRVSVSIKPNKKLLLGSDYHLFFLADTHDSFYPESGSGRSLNGYGKHPGFSSFVGSEIDLDATYTISKWAVVRAGYGHFFAGDYIKSSLAATGGATDSDWLYAQFTINF